MTLTRRQRRAVDKHVGKRELDRKARTLTARVHELASQGYAPPTIARVTGLPSGVVDVVLKDAEEGEGAGYGAL